MQRQSITVDEADDIFAIKKMWVEGIILFSVLLYE